MIYRQKGTKILKWTAKSFLNYRSHYQANNIFVTCLSVERYFVKSYCANTFKCEILNSCHVLADLPYDDLDILIKLQKLVRRSVNPSLAISLKILAHWRRVISFSRTYSLRLNRLIRRSQLKKIPRDAEEKRDVSADTG